MKVRAERLLTTLLAVAPGVPLAAPALGQAPPAAPNATTQECFHILPPSGPPFFPMLLNGCTGATWILVRNYVPDDKGNPAGSFIWRWSPMLVDQGEATLSNVIPTAPAPPGQPRHQ